MVSLSSRPNMQKESDKKANYRKLKENLWVAMGLSLLFGLSWGIGFLASTGLPSFIQIIFEWAFTIMTAFQGLIIFILYCLRAAEVRKVWKRILCCAHDRKKSKRMLSFEPSGSGWTGTLTTKLSTLRKHTSKTIINTLSLKNRPVNSDLNKAELSTLRSVHFSNDNAFLHESGFTSKNGDLKDNASHPDSTNSRDSAENSNLQHVEVQFEQPSSNNFQADESTPQSP